MKISVICPTFNSEKFIISTLTSVAAQTIQPFEIIVSDDGSTDNTVGLVQDFSSKYKGDVYWNILIGAHKGPGSARNAGILAAKGDWIAFLDSDDRWNINKIETIIAQTIKTPNSNFFCHNEDFIDITGSISKLRYGQRYDSNQLLSTQLYKGNMFSTSAVACQKKLLIEHGLFDEDLKTAQDYELWLRISPHIKPVFMPEVLGNYIERSGNITSTYFWLRILNELKIAIRHRNKSNFYGLNIRIARIFLSFLRQYWMTLKKRLNNVVENN